MSIFAKPTPHAEQEGAFRILFLHGLEGSPEGEKAIYLKKKWNADVPLLRTDQLRELRSLHSNVEWKELPKRDLKKAVDIVYKDALAAVSYTNPDVIIGSSMSGALLARLVIEGKWSGASIFLAPAIDELLGSVDLPEMKNSIWVLGETDDIVSNLPNIKHCMNVGGSLFISPNDGHRLHGALSSGLIECAIITAIEIDQLNTYL